MKKILVCALFICSSGLFAAPQVENPFRIVASPQIGRMKLDIDSVGSLKGTVKGGTATFEYKPSKGVYAMGSSEYVMGTLKSMNSMKRYIHDLDSAILLGASYPMPYFSLLDITLFSGLGYQLTTQEIFADDFITSKHWRYSHFQIPVGGILDFRFTPIFGVRVNAAWLPQLRSRLTMNQVHGYKWKLKNMAGYIVEVPFYFLFPRSASVQGEFNIEPYLKRSVDGHLNAAIPSGATYTLPEQSYKTWGLKVGFGIRF